MAKPKEILLEEEREFFKTIRNGSRRLLKMLGEDDFKKHYVSKNRIDEGNFHRVMERIRARLSGKDLERAEGVAQLIRAAIEQVSIRYIGWAETKSKSMASHYNVDRIEATSVAGWALYRACFRYVPQTNFSSYVEHWIRQGLERIQIPYVCTLDAHMKGEDGDCRESFLDQRASDLPSPQVILEDQQLTSHVVHLMDGLPEEKRAVVVNWWVNGEFEPRNEELIRTFAQVAIDTYDI